MNLHSRNFSSEPVARTARQGRLVDKVAVITGAASGIGKEIALAFAAEGAKVVIADVDQTAAQETASEIDPLTERALGVAMDVSSEEQVEAGMARAIEFFGRIDILISNAGVQIVAPLVEFEFTKWKKLLSIHLDGAFLTTRAALRQMYRQKSGSIIYMGSVHSKEASPLKAPYVTAKHGLVGLAKVVAKEGAAYGVRANVICPGFVRTPLVEKQIPEQARELGISEADVVKIGDAEGNRRRRVHDRSGRGGNSSISGSFPIERTHRPVGRGQPRMVHAVDASEEAKVGGGHRLPPRRGYERRFKVDHSA